MHIYQEKFDLKPMKATDYAKIRRKGNLLDYYIEKKYDGARCMIHICSNIVRLFSSNGIRFNHPKLENVLKFSLQEHKKFADRIPRHIEDHMDDYIKDEHLFFANGNYILDGELCYDDGKVNKRSSISGRLNKALHGCDIGMDREDRDIRFHVFDIINLNGSYTYEARRKQLTNFLRFVNDYNYKHYDYPVIIPVECSKVYKLNMIDEVFERYIDNGFEGIVLKHKDSCYSFGTRSKEWLKSKAILTADLRCIGYTPGKGKYEGMIGALELVDESGKFTVSVGAGMSDYDRGKFPEFYRGKIIEIEYNSKTENSLFLPRFIRVRDDKGEADVL